MKPLLIYVEGFLSYRDEAIVDLKDMSAVAIVGENGSGKSSLVEAMTWALYGRGRGRGPDDYVHSAATRCLVRVEFELDGGRYAVERHRERGAHGKSYLGLFSLVDGLWLPVGGDSITETQAAIEDLLGMNGDLWEATAYIGQGKADAFTQLRPAARKQLLADLLELDRFAVWADKARELSREAAGKLDGIRRRAEAIGDVDDKLTTVDAQIDQLDSDRAVNDSHGAEISEQLIQAQYALREAELAQHGAESLRDQLEQLRAARHKEAAGIDSEGARLDQDLRLAESAERLAAADVEQTRAIAGQLSTLDKTTREIEVSLEAAIGEVDHLALQLEDERATYQAQKALLDTLDSSEVDERIRLLESTDAGVCPACGAELSPESREQLVKNLYAERGKMLAEREIVTENCNRAADTGQVLAPLLDSRKAQLPRLRAELADALTAHARASTQAEQLDSLEDRYVEATARVQTAREAIEDFTTRRLAAREPSKRELELEEQLRVAGKSALALVELKAVVITHETDLRKVQEEAQAIAGHLGAANQARSALVDQMAEAEILVRDFERFTRIRSELDLIAEAFGRDGIPTLIIERAIPALEEEANRLLRQMTGERFTLRVDSLRALKGGGTKESLEVIVADDVSERPLEALSGGERQCVDLSLRIALARLLAHRAGRPIETLIIDEGFTALDVVHRQRTIEVLHGLLEEFRTVLFVTHLQELADAFPARLEVTRDADGSHVSAVGVAEAVPA